jgi:hypothetical protein
MRPPEIRYPILWITAAIAVGLGCWLARPGLDAVAQSLRTRWKRAVQGPPVPSSPAPRVVAGPMVRRVLLLRDGVGATDRPGGRVVETIGRRQFADVYDVWPLKGEPTHYRIGNRRAFGWVTAADVLPWDTRLVLDGPDAAPALPIVGWNEEGRVRVADWAPDQPWRRVAGERWLDAGAAPDSSWGALISRVELLALLRRLMANEPASLLRAQALTGDLATRRAWSEPDLAALRNALPDRAFGGAGADRRRIIEALSRLNEQWTPDASWSSLEYRAIPLDALP